LSRLLKVAIGEAVRMSSGRLFHTAGLDLPHRMPRMWHKVVGWHLFLFLLWPDTTCNSYICDSCVVLLLVHDRRFAVHCS